MSGSASPAPIEGSRTSSLRRMHRATYAPVVPLRPGEVIAGTYRVGGLLGQGGMGAVYQAVRLLDGAVVALKVMRAEHSNDSNMAERFEREAAMGRKVQSPYVSTIHDFGRAGDGMMYMVMELLRGKPLAQHLDEQLVLPWREAAKIARQVALGLQAVHAAGVIHRDLKPENVFLCEGGAIKLLDFGIAKEYGPDWKSGKVTGRPLTQAGTVLGTPLYMSPEAVTQSPSGPPTDLYSLGSMMFEMLTGRLLFEEEQSVILMGMHLRARPDRICLVRPDLGIPQELDELVDRLLAKDPTKRPKDAASVAEDLDRISRTVARTGDTGAFPLASVSEHRRAAASLPTEVTSRVEPTPIGGDADGELSDITIPRKPAPDPIRVPTTVDAPVFVEPSAVGNLVPASGRGGRGALLLVAPLLMVVVVFSVWRATRPREVVTTPIERTEVPTATPPTPGAPTHVPEVSGHDIAPLPLGEDPPADSRVTVRFELTPIDARVSEDGVPITERELSLHRDGAVHEFLLQAPGRLSQRVRVTADGDRTVRITLRPRTSGVGSGAGGSGTGGSGTGGSGTGGTGGTGGSDVVRTF